MGIILMKKFLLLVLAMMLCAGAAMAGEKQHAWTADFDRDGETEMFVLTGEDKALYTMGNLVYVDGDRTVDVMMGAGFKVEDCCVWEMEDTILFKAEESYGIGGSVSYVYSIENGKTPDGKNIFGIGVDSNVNIASVLGVLNAINRAEVPVT